MTDPAAFRSLSSYIMGLPSRNGFRIVQELVDVAHVDLTPAQERQLANLLGARNRDLEPEIEERLREFIRQFENPANRRAVRKPADEQEVIRDFMDDLARLREEPTREDEAEEPSLPNNDLARSRYEREASWYRRLYDGRKPGLLTALLLALGASGDLGTGIWANWRDRQRLMMALGQPYAANVPEVRPAIPAPDGLSPMEELEEAGGRLSRWLKRKAILLLIAWVVGGLLIAVLMQTAFHGSVFGYAVVGYVLLTIWALWQSFMEVSYLFSAEHEREVMFSELRAVLNEMRDEHGNPPLLPHAGAKVSNPINMAAVNKKLGDNVSPIHRKDINNFTADIYGPNPTFNPDDRNTWPKWAKGYRDA